MINQTKEKQKEFNLGLWVNTEKIRTKGQKDVADMRNF